MHASSRLTQPTGDGRYKFEDIKSIAGSEVPAAPDVQKGNKTWFSKYLFRFSHGGRRKERGDKELMATHSAPVMHSSSHRSAFSNSLPSETSLVEDRTTRDLTGRHRLSKPMSLHSTDSPVIPGSRVSTLKQKMRELAKRQYQVEAETLLTSINGKLAQAKNGDISESRQTGPVRLNSSVRLGKSGKGKFKHSTLEDKLERRKALRQILENAEEYMDGVKKCDEILRALPPLPLKTEYVEKWLTESSTEFTNSDPSQPDLASISDTDKTEKPGQSASPALSTENTERTEFGTTISENKLSQSILGTDGTISSRKVSYRRNQKQMLAGREDSCDELMMGKVCPVHSCTCTLSSNNPDLHSTACPSNDMKDGEGPPNEPWQQIPGESMLTQMERRAIDESQALRIKSNSSIGETVPLSLPPDLDMLDIFDPFPRSPNSSLTPAAVAIEPAWTKSEFPENLIHPFPVESPRRQTSSDSCQSRTVRAGAEQLTTEQNPALDRAARRRKGRFYFRLRLNSRVRRKLSSYIFSRKPFGLTELKSTPSKISLKLHVPSPVTVLLESPTDSNEGDIAGTRNPDGIAQEEETGSPIELLNSSQSNPVISSMVKQNEKLVASIANLFTTLQNHVQRSEDDRKVFVYFLRKSVEQKSGDHHVQNPGLDKLNTDGTQPATASRSTSLVSRQNCLMIAQAVDTALPVSGKSQEKSSESRAIRRNPESNEAQLLKQIGASTKQSEESFANPADLNHVSTASIKATTVQPSRSNTTNGDKFRNFFSNDTGSFFGEEEPLEPGTPTVSEIDYGSVELLPERVRDRVVASERFVSDGNHREFKNFFSDETGTSFGDEDPVESGTPTMSEADYGSEQLLPESVRNQDASNTVTSPDAGTLVRDKRVPELGQSTAPDDHNCCGELAAKDSNQGEFNNFFSNETGTFFGSENPLEPGTPTRSDSYNYSFEIDLPVDRETDDSLSESLLGRDADVFVTPGQSIAAAGEEASSDNSAVYGTPKADIADSILSLSTKRSRKATSQRADPSTSSATVGPLSGSDLDRSRTATNLVKSPKIDRSRRIRRQVKSTHDLNKIPTISSKIPTKSGNKPKSPPIPAPRFNRKGDSASNSTFVTGPVQLAVQTHSFYISNSGSDGSKSDMPDSDERPVTAVHPARMSRIVPSRPPVACQTASSPLEQNETPSIKLRTLPKLASKRKPAVTPRTVELLSPKPAKGQLQLGGSKNLLTADAFRVNISDSTMVDSETGITFHPARSSQGAPGDSTTGNELGPLKLNVCCDVERMTESELQEKLRDLHSDNGTPSPLIELLEYLFYLLGLRGPQSEEDLIIPSCHVEDSMILWNAWKSKVFTLPEQTSGDSGNAVNMYALHSVDRCFHFLSTYCRVPQWDFTVVQRSTLEANGDVKALYELFRSGIIELPSDRPKFFTDNVPNNRRSLRLFLMNMFRFEMEGQSESVQRQKCLLYVHLFKNDAVGSPSADQITEYRELLKAFRMEEITIFTKKDDIFIDITVHHWLSSHDKHHERPALNTVFRELRRETKRWLTQTTFINASRRYGPLGALKSMAVKYLRGVLGSMSHDDRTFVSNVLQIEQDLKTGEWVAADPFLVNVDALGLEQAVRDYIVPYRFEGEFNLPNHKAPVSKKDTDRQETFQILEEICVQESISNQLLERQAPALPKADLKTLSRTQFYKKQLKDPDIRKHLLRRRQTGMAESGDGTKNGDTENRRLYEKIERDLMSRLPVDPNSLGRTPKLPAKDNDKHKRRRNSSPVGSVATIDDGSISLNLEARPKVQLRVPDGQRANGRHGIQEPREGLRRNGPPASSITLSQYDVSSGEMPAQTKYLKHTETPRRSGKATDRPSHPPLQQSPAAYRLPVITTDFLQASDTHRRKTNAANETVQQESYFSPNMTRFVSAKLGQR